MTPSFDLGFLLCMILKAPGREVAWDSAWQFRPPWPITSLHQFQVENGLARQLRHANEERRGVAALGWKRWKDLFSEGLLQVADIKWPLALEVATAWNWQIRGEVPPANLVLHPAIALVSDATHFLSFDPRSRALAKQAQLALVPNTL